VGVLTSVNCSATVARRIASAFHEDAMADFAHVDGVAAFTHTTGCGTAYTGEGVENLQRTLSGYARHANFHSVVVIGLGCEVNQIDRLIKEMGLERSDRLKTFTIQDVGGTAKAIEHGRGLVRELVQEANLARRAPAPVSAITLGLQCGGSDGWSGVTANPALGVASDLLVAHGGTAILSETPEIYGAENLLLRRAANPEVAQKLIDRLEWWEDYVARNHASLDNNPSPGNKAGGLTTILEKSLGAVAKSGTTPLNDVYRYGEAISQKGFVFMDSPGYDPCSATGQIAAGATMIAFTTGRGSVFGSKPAPCVKLASNAALAAHMDDDIDVDCSPVLSGESVAEAGARVFEEILAVASGKPSKSEALGLGDEEFVPWQIGAAM
jgi:altronate hydrolase